MSLVYIYDEHLSVIKMYDTSLMGEATIDMKINEASTFYTKFEEMLPSQARYIAVQDPIANRRGTDDEFLLYRVHSDQLSDDGMYEYVWTEFAYDELSFDGYITDKRPNNISFHDVLALVLTGTKWKVGLTNIEGTTSIDFYYESPMDAIKKINEKFHAEFRFWVRLDDDGTIVERIVNAVNRRGQNTGRRFETTSNVLSVTAQEDLSNIYSAIVPRGKGEQVSEGGDDGPDGYGRRITIKDVEWSKAKGDPVDKPLGQEWIALEQGETLVDGRLRFKIVVFEDDTDINQLARDGYAQLVKDSVPKIQLSGNASDLGVSEIGDTVQVVDKAKHIEYEARIFHITYDLIDHTNTKVEFGDDIINSNSINSKIDSIVIKQDQIVNETNWAVQQANGKNTNYYGIAKPNNPQEGDAWFWEDGENSGIKVFKRGDWVDVVDTQTQARITNEVKNAVDTATKYADDLNRRQANATNSLAGELTRKANSLSASQQNIASQASAYTDSAVADANAKAAQIGQSAAQNAQRALDAAKKDFTSSFASQASQTASMASDVTSKASQYASQAKSEAIAVATSADGVVRKEFKSTTDSMTATIQQVKSDADGGISKAQTTATQALNGLSTKVEKTEYNKTTGDLTSKINTTSDTAEKSKQDIADIKVANDKQDNRMLQIEKDATGVKQTVSDLSTEQGKQRGSISKLEQRADGFDATVTKVNNLSVGGRNYVLNTGVPFVVSGNGTDYHDTYGKVVFYSPIKNWGVTGKTYTISFKWTLSTALTTDSKSSIFFNQSPWQEQVFNIPANATSGNVVFTFNLANGITTARNDVTGMTFRVNSWLDSSNTFTIEKFQFEAGSIATDWKPAPEDLSSATARAQLTADNATLSINNYKTDADGRISKAQADIKVNADAIATKVAKTDYDKKTGDLTTSVNKAQQTADTASQTIGTYKESNDKRVSAAETNIKANADAIKSTVSKTDFDKATGKINGDISTLQQRAEGFDATVSKVNNLAVGGRNYIINSSGMNASYTIRPSVKPDASTSIYVNSAITFNSDSITSTYTGTGSQEWYYALAEAFKTYDSAGLDKTKQYTISVDIKGTVPRVAFRINDVFSPTLSINNSTWTRLKYTFKFNDLGGTNTDKFYIRLNAISGSHVGNFVKGQTLSFRNFKLEEGNVSTDWTPAPEDINTQLAQVKITADGVYQTVNDPKTGLNTRVSTAEGNITKVQNSVGSMSNTVTETADGLTREIADRKTGDSNTLQAGKDFTTSQIKSYDTGMQSRLSQTSDALIAQISSLNLVNNSGFEYVNDNQLQGWHKGSAWGATLTFNSGFYIHEQNPDGTIAIRHDYAKDASWIYSDPIPTTANANFAGSIEIAEGPGWNTSSQVPFAIDVKYYDANKNAINNLRINYAGTTIGGAWPRKSFTLTTPANTKYIAFGIGWNGGSIAFKRPALYAGSKDYGYMPSSKTSNQTALQLFKDNFQIGIKDNIGNIISGINGDTSGLMLTGKHIFLDGEVTVVGKSWLDGAVIKDASIGRAHIADLSVDSSKIIDLDVNKLSGNVANFIRTYWDGRYGSTSIDSEGMTVSAGLATTMFDKDGMKFSKSGRSVGRIGVNDLYQDFSKKGLYFGLESTGDFMAWGAQNYAGNPYSTKLSWFRTGAVPSNLPGLIEGFNFEDNVAFINPVEIRGGIKLQGANDRLLVRASNLNGGHYPTFGGPSAYFVYAGSDIYLSSNGTSINLTKIAKAFGGIRTAAIPTGFNSNGTATGWYNVDMG